MIRAFVKSADDKLPIIAGITGEVDRSGCAGGEALRCRRGIRRFALSFTVGCGVLAIRMAPLVDRYRVVAKKGSPLILFQHPDVTKATYNLKTLLDISAQPGGLSHENGVRNYAPLIPRFR